MLLNKTIALIITITLIFHPPLFSSQNLAPAGIQETDSSYAIQQVLTRLGIIRKGLDDKDHPWVRVTTAESIIKEIDTFDKELDTVADILIDTLNTEEEKEARAAEAEALLAIGEKFSSSDLYYPESAIKALCGIVMKREDGSFIVDDRGLRVKAAQKLFDVGADLHKRNSFEMAYDAYIHAAIVDDEDIRRKTAKKIFEAGKAIYFLNGWKSKAKADKIAQSLIVRLKYGDSELKKSAIEDLMEMDKLPHYGSIMNAIIANIKSLDLVVFSIAQKALIQMGAEEDMQSVEEELVESLNEKIKGIGAYINLVIAEKVIEKQKEKTDVYPKIVYISIFDALSFGNVGTRKHAVTIIKENIIYAKNIINIIESLMKTALHDKAQVVRALAAETLGESKDIRAIDTLITALNRRRLGVGKEAAEALSKFGGTKAMHALANVVLNWRRFPTVRVAAIRGLQRFKKIDFDAALALNTALRSQFPSVAKEAAIAYRYFGDIEAMYPQDTEEPEKTREHFNEALLIYLRNALIQTALKETQFDTWIEVRGSAIQSLGFFKNSEEVLTVLSRILLTDFQPYMQKSAAISLGEYGSEKAVQVLCKVAQNPDKNRDVRIAATHSLGKIKSKNAVSALLEIASNGKNDVRLVKAAREALREISKELEKQKDTELQVAAIISFLENKPFFKLIQNSL